MRSVRINADGLYPAVSEPGAVAAKELGPSDQTLRNWIKAATKGKLNVAYITEFPLPQAA